MKKFIWISLTLASMGLFGLFLMFGSGPVPDVNQWKTSYIHVGEIIGGMRVGQSFVSNRDRLSAIAIRMATWDRRNTRDIIFHLRSSPTATKDLAKVIVNASEITDNRFHRFSFAPLPGSKDKSYYFYIESPKSTSGDAITVWINRDSNVYEEGSRFSDDLPQKGDLVFQTYYQGRLITSLTKEILPRFLKRKALLIFFVGLSAVLLITLSLTIPGRYEYLREKFQKVPLWIFPLILSLAFFSLNRALIYPDSGRYLVWALNIYKGHGLVDVHWWPMPGRPVFPFLIALFFRLFGVSVKHAFWVVRSFYVLNVLLVYLVGKKFYGKWVGLIASLFVLSCFNVNQWSSALLLDNVAAFFLILSLLLIFHAFESKKFLWFVLAGFSLGTAFLVKEVAILFFPLPLLVLAFIKDYHCRRNIYGTLVLIGAVVLILSPGALYVSRITSSRFLRLEPLYRLVVGTISGAFSGNKGPGEVFTLWTTVKSSLHLFINYYKRDVAPNFILAPLFVISWLFTLFSALLKRNKSDKVMLFSLLLLFPLILFLGRWNWGLRQSIIIFFLSYLTLAHTTLRGTKWILSKLRFSRWEPGRTAQILAVPFLVNVLVGVMLLGNGERGIRFFSTRSNLIGVISGDGIGWKTPGLFGDYPRDAGRWILHNISPHSRIMCDWFWLRSIYFFSQGNYRIHDLRLELKAQRARRARRKQSISSDQKEKILFLWSSWDSEELGNSLKALVEKDLLGAIKEKSIEYVITTAKRGFLSLYFEANPGFVKIKEFDGKIKIFAVRNIEPYHKFKTRIGIKTRSFLKNLEKRKPARYKKLVNAYFRDGLGWNNEEIQKFMRGRSDFPQLRFYKIY